MNNHSYICYVNLKNQPKFQLIFPVNSSGAVKLQLKFYIRLWVRLLIVALRFWRCMEGAKPNNFLKSFEK